MGKPFTFHFSYGAKDTPRVMCVVDLQASCAVCGYQEIQRFYRGVPFHSLSNPSFHLLVSQASSWLSFACTNCGSAVDQAQCERGAVTYGFADGAGLVVGHFRCDERGQVAHQGYTLSGGKRLDPQSLPPWTKREPVSEADMEPSLNEDLMFEACGRVMSLKGVWRSLLAEHLACGEALMEQVSPGCWFVVGADEDDVEALVAEGEDEVLRALADKGEVVLMSLMDPPEGLPWLKAPSEVHGNPRHWLPPDILEALTEGRLCAEVYMRRADVEEAFLGALRRARLEFRVDDSSGETWVLDVTTPRGVSYDAGVPMSALMAMAAHTAITPGESARMGAEEVVADLLRVDLGAG